MDTFIDFDTNDTGDMSLTDDQTVMEILPDGHGGADLMADGKLVHHVETDAQGNHYVYHDGVLEQLITPNGHGGADVYQLHQADALGTENPSLTDYLSHTGNVDDVLNYDDPLMHSQEYQPDPFDASKK